MSLYSQEQVAPGSFPPPSRASGALHPYPHRGCAPFFLRASPSKVLPRPHSSKLVAGALVFARKVGRRNLNKLRLWLFNNCQVTKNAKYCDLYCWQEIYLKSPPLIEWRLNLDTLDSNVLSEIYLIKMFYLTKNQNEYDRTEKTAITISIYIVNAPLYIIKRRVLIIKIVMATNYVHDGKWSLLTMTCIAF